MFFKIENIIINSLAICHFVIDMERNAYVYNDPTIRTLPYVGRCCFIFYPQKVNIQQHLFYI